MSRRSHDLLLFWQRLENAGAGAAVIDELQWLHKHWEWCERQLSTGTLKVSGSPLGHVAEFQSAFSLAVHQRPDGPPALTSATAQELRAEIQASGWSLLSVLAPPIPLDYIRSLACQSVTAAETLAKAKQGGLITRKHARERCGF